MGAEMLHKEMTCAGLAPDTSSYNAILTTCARAKDADKAEAWMKRLLAEAPRVVADASSYCAVADACAQAGEIKRAERWIAHMEKLGFRATASTFGILMHACAKTGDG